MTQQAESSGWDVATRLEHSHGGVPCVATAEIRRLQAENEALRTALAQQGKQQPVCAGCGIPEGDVHISTCQSGKWPLRVSNGDTAAPAPQPVIGINGMTEAETGASMSVRGLSKPVQGNAELIARSTKVAAELDDFNSSMDRKAAKCIRELLTALQSAQPVAVVQQGYKPSCLHGDDDYCKACYMQETTAALQDIIPVQPNIKNQIFTDISAPQPAQGGVTRRKIFACVHCHGIYADQAVTQCDCMEGTGADFVEGFAEYPSALQSAQPVAPLTDGQIEDIGFEMLYEVQRKDFIAFARAIEAAHGIKEVK